MPKKNKTAKQEGMSPEQIAAANKDGISFLQQAFPFLTIDQGMNAASGGMSNLLESAVPLFGGMIQSGYENFDRNPSKQATATLADQTLGTNTVDSISRDTIPTPFAEPELSPYERRIRELMANRGMTREQAVANQAAAMQAGGDINDNGAITNNEWAMKLGSDFDNDGKVTNQEFAQWKQQNPDHQAAGGTKYTGLPGQNGLFTVQQPQVAQQAPQGYVPNGFMGGRRGGRR